MSKLKIGNFHQEFDGKGIDIGALRSQFCTKNVKIYQNIQKMILQCQTRLCGGQAGTALDSAQNCLSTMEGDK